MTIHITIKGDNYRTTHIDKVLETENDEIVSEIKKLIVRYERGSRNSIGTNGVDSRNISNGTDKLLEEVQMNPLMKTKGKWPGDETFNELMKG